MLVELLVLDIAAWPCSVGILISFTFFWRTLHWPAGGVDFGHFGIVVIDCLEKRLLGHMLGLTVPFLIPSVPVSEGFEIRHGCQFLSSLVRALAKLFGGLDRFMSCRVGSHLSRLRHLGWNQRSHGLTSRPLESCHHQCLKAVCGGSGISKGFSFGASRWHFEAPTLH